MRTFKTTAIIFDLDGTLFDLREPIFKQVQTWTAEFNGQPATREQIASALCFHISGQVDCLIPDESKRPAALLRAQQLMDESMGTALLHTQTLETLKHLQGRGVKLGVLTARSSYHALHDLEYHDIADYFETIVHADRVRHPKPHPEGLKLALNELNVLPQHTIMVGDTIVDVAVGKAVGARTVGVTHGFGTVEDLQRAGADHIVHDIPSVLKVLE